MIKSFVMKKRYEKPVAYVIDITPCSLLSVSGFNIDSDSKGDHEEDFVNGRRSVWGDLWDRGNDDSTRK